MDPRGSRSDVGGLWCAAHGQQVDQCPGWSGSGRTLSVPPEPQRVTGFAITSGREQRLRDLWLRRTPRRRGRSRSPRGTACADCHDHSTTGKPPRSHGSRRRAGGKRTYAAVAADVGVTGETLRSWVRQADELAGRGNRDEPVAEGRDEELARLRAENGRLRKAEKEWELEREILRRAAAYFAREVK